MGVPFELLAPRLGQAPTAVRRAPQQRAAPAATARRAHGRDLEEAALRLLLAMLPGSTTPQPEVLPALAELPPEEAFWDSSCRSLFSVFRVLYQEKAGVPPELGELRERLEAAAEGASVDLVARLVIQGADGPGDVPRPVGIPDGKTQSCADRLRESLRDLHQRWREQRSQQLNREMLEAQRSGDEPRLQRLVEEKSELSRAIHRPTEGSPSGALARLSTRSPS
jgi:hypothetical protein